MFAVYESEYDPQTGQTTHNSHSKAFEKCYKDCDDSISYCQKFCDNNHGKLYHSSQQYEACTLTCADYRDSCVRTCQLSDPMWQYKGPYAECQRDAGCFTSTRLSDLDIKCAEKNKGKIKKCCLKKCSNIQDADCNSYCDLSKKIFTGTLDFPTIKVKDQHNTYKNYPDNTMYYSLVGVGLALVIFFLLQQREK